MTTVTFPTRLGGSGLTVSDDANPNTGLANGGHRTRFVPALQGTIDMANYVFQYANKIDKAAADAQKAENAKNYVEAVSSEYATNVLEQFRRGSSLDINFEKGEYKTDDGVSTNNTSGSGIVTAQRNTPKWVEKPSGNLESSGINSISRDWFISGNAQCKPESSSSNILPFSSDLSNSSWTRSSSVTSIGSSVQGFFAINGDPSVGSVTIRSTVSTVLASNSYTFSGRFKPMNAESLLVYLTSEFVSSGTNTRVRIDSSTLKMSVVFNPNGTSISNMYVKKCRDGSIFWTFTAFCFNGSTAFRPLYYASGEGSISTPSDIPSGNLLSLGWLQVEQGTMFTSPIPNSGASPAGRGSDSISIPLSGVWSAYQGTWYVEGNISTMPSGATNIISPSSEAGERLMYFFGTSTIRTFDGMLQCSADMGTDFMVGDRLKICVTIYPDSTYQIFANGMASPRRNHNGKFLNPTTMQQILLSSESQKCFSFSSVIYKPVAITESEATILTKV